MTIITEESRNKIELHGGQHHFSLSRRISPMEKLNRTFFRRLRTMLRTDNTVRPRKSNFNWTSHHKEAGFNRGAPIFKIGDVSERKYDFSVSMPLDIYREEKPKRKKPLMKRILFQVEQYCDKSTLHGLRYVGDPTLSLCERLFWFLSFAAAVTFAGYYISNIYEKWNRSPVIISFSPFDATLDSIPFPAVTICNMNQAKKSEVEKLKKTGTSIQKKLLDDACDSNTFNDTEDEISWNTLQHFLITVGQSCSDILRVCEWKSERVNCEDFFNNDLTDEGLCCSFNRLPPDYIYWNSRSLSYLNQTYPAHIYDWNPEDGFPDKNTGDPTYIPKRPLGSGTHLGLTLILDAQTDEYYCSSTYSVGFKVILSNPIETPKMKDFGFMLAPGQEARISIVPTIREATSTLRDVSIEKRQCYFANERELKYYRKYTQRNCKLECQSNYTLNLCKCVPYFLPKNSAIKICGKSDDQCASEAKDIIELAVNGTSCNCLPGCFEMIYKKSGSYANLDPREVQDVLKDEDLEYISRNLVVAHFYFQNGKFTKQIKSQLYGFTELLSNSGGLLGLCLGFSVLSLVELLYFLTLKVLCTFVKKKLSTRTSGSHSVIPFAK